MELRFRGLRGCAAKNGSVSLLEVCLPGSPVAPRAFWLSSLPPRPLCPSSLLRGRQAWCQSILIEGAALWTGMAASSGRLLAGSRILRRGVIPGRWLGCINSAGCRDDGRSIEHVRWVDRGVSPMSGCKSRIRPRRTRVHEIVLGRREAGDPVDRPASARPARTSGQLGWSASCSRDPGMHGHRTGEAARAGPHTSVSSRPPWRKRAPEKAGAQACRLQGIPGRPGPRSGGK